MGSKLRTFGYYQLGVTQQPPKTVYSWHFLLESLFPENALTIRRIPMEVWLNSLVLWVTDSKEFKTFFSTFFFFMKEIERGNEHVMC